MGKKKGVKVELLSPSAMTDVLTNNRYVIDMDINVPGCSHWDKDDRTCSEAGESQAKRVKRKRKRKNQRAANKTANQNNQKTECVESVKEENEPRLADWTERTIDVALQAKRQSRKRRRINKSAAKAMLNSSQSNGNNSVIAEMKEPETKMNRPRTSSQIAKQKHDQSRQACVLAFKILTLVREEFGGKQMRNRRMQLCNPLPRATTCGIARSAIDQGTNDGIYRSPDPDCRDCSVSRHNGVDHADRHNYRITPSSTSGVNRSIHGTSRVKLSAPALANQSADWSDGKHSCRRQKKQTVKGVARPGAGNNHMVGATASLPTGELPNASRVEDLPGFVYDPVKNAYYKVVPSEYNQNKGAITEKHLEVPVTAKNFQYTKRTNILNILQGRNCGMVAANNFNFRTSTAIVQSWKSFGDETKLLNTAGFVNRLLCSEEGRVVGLLEDEQGELVQEIMIDLTGNFPAGYLSSYQQHRHKWSNDINALQENSLFRCWNFSHNDPLFNFDGSDRIRRNVMSSYLGVEVRVDQISDMRFTKFKDFNLLFSHHPSPGMEGGATMAVCGRLREESLDEPRLNFRFGVTSIGCCAWCPTLSKFTVGTESSSLLIHPEVTGNYSRLETEQSCVLAQSIGDKILSCREVDPACSAVRGEGRSFVTTSDREQGWLFIILSNLLQSSRSK